MAVSCMTLLEQAPDVRTAVDHVMTCGRLVRARDLHALVGWLKGVKRSAIAELRGIAAGIRRDPAAVEAPLASEWSNGQTESHINRVKVLKRQMYGRAELDLLWRRFLQAS